MPGRTSTAFPLREWDGEPGGLLTLSQLAAVPEGRRAATRLREVATPMSHLATAMPDEQLTDVLPRMSGLPRIPAAMHTAGHALVLSPDGSIVGLLTPADLTRAGQFGALRRNGATAPSGMAGSRS
jgi:CBS domain-containing protein